jgi:hypothetical protein
VTGQFPSDSRQLAGSGQPESSRGTGQLIEWHVAGNAMSDSSNEQRSHRLAQEQARLRHQVANGAADVAATEDKVAGAYKQMAEQQKPLLHVRACDLAGSEGHERQSSDL